MCWKWYLIVSCNSGYLFNKRFNDLDAFKEQVKDGKKLEKKDTNKKEKDDDFEMPKAKDEK